MIFTGYDEAVNYAHNKFYNKIIIQRLFYYLFHVWARPKTITLYTIKKYFVLFCYVVACLPIGGDGYIAY
jgi:hypothetical protein